MTFLVPLLVLVPLLGAAVALGLLRHQKLQRAITVAVLVIALAVAATLMVLELQGFVRTLPSGRYRA